MGFNLRVQYTLYQPQLRSLFLQGKLLFYFGKHTIIVSDFKQIIFFSLGVTAEYDFHVAVCSGLTSVYEQMNLSEDIMQGQTFQSLELKDFCEEGVKELQEHKLNWC